MKNPCSIAPSILSADFSVLKQELESLGSADLIHLDIMDGHFVDSISFGQPILRSVASSTTLPIDVHLMVEQPERMCRSVIEAGANSVTFHLEATRHWQSIVDNIHSCGKKAGVALNPGTPVSWLESIIQEIDLILVLAVNPGKPNQRFIPHTLYKLQELSDLCKRNNVSPLLEVDGGIDASNARACVEAGADILVAGRSVMGADNRADAIDQLRQVALLC